MEISGRLQHVDETDEFSSVKEYVLYILGQVIEKFDGEKPSYSDEAKIKERLNKLGYLE